MVNGCWHLGLIRDENQHLDSECERVGMDTESEDRFGEIEKEEPVVGSQERVTGAR